MINERTSTQGNTPTSANIQYGYPTSPFDMMNIAPMQNPSDLYSYYSPSLYQPFGQFDDHNQWGSTDTSAGVPPQHPGSLQYHPQMYTPSPHDIPRSPFDYPPPHAYPHYHPAFPPSTYAGPPSTGTSAFDMSWNPHNLSMQQQMQVVAQQQMTPIGAGPISNKKPSAYDGYPSTGGVGDMLAQQMNSVDLGNKDSNNYDNGTHDNIQNVNVLSPRQQQQQQQQQHYQSNSSHLSLSRPSQIPAPSGPKSYASVVSADTINTASNKSTPSISNLTVRSSEYNNNPISNFSNDTYNSRSNTQQQQSRNGTTGYNSRNQPNTEGFLNWRNNNSSSNSRDNQNSSNYSDRSSNKRQNYPSSRTITNSMNGSNSASAMEGNNQEVFETRKRNHQYNPKDFNLNPKGARFFVIKSYSEDDVHRAIKYNIWCSTEHGNKRLDAAFREREGKGPVYLFFSVNASGHFCGMAEMMSPLDYENQTDVWYMSNKWQGKFEVKWIYVKDVPNQQFRNIRLENNDNKPVTNSRDTQEVPYEKGKLMLKTMHMYRDKTSIFDDFQYYESKQAEEEEVPKQPTTNDHNTNPRGNNRRQMPSNRTSATNQSEQQNENNGEQE